MSFQSDANSTYVNNQSVDKGAVRALWTAVDGIVSEVRDGRVWHTSSDNLASQTPPEGADQISIATNAGQIFYRRISAPGTVDPAIHAQTADGTWWRLSEDTRALRSNSGKSFFSRASAVSFGQENLPSALGLITTREGDWVAYRGANQFADDPLFAPDDPEAPTNGPWWGVLDRIPVQAMFSYALSALGVIPLGNIGGTGNHITAQIVTAGQRAQVGFSIANTFALIPPATNIDEGGAFITIDGDVEREILDEDGNSLPPGYIAPWRTHYLQRRGESFRVILGPFSRADFEAVLPPVAGDGTLTPLITSSDRALLWLYDGLLDAAGLSPALRDDAVRDIAPRVDSSSGFVPLTKSGQRLITWLDETGFNYVGRDERPEPDTVLARTVTDGRSLNLWRTRIAQVAMGVPAAKARLVMLGDSYIQTHWIPREFKTLLDAEHGSGGEGWRPAVQGDSLSDATYTVSGWTQVDGSANSTFPYNPGPDGLLLYTSGTDATATWTNAVATEFRIFHYQYGGTLRWRVDGGAWTSVTADTSETLDVITISGLSDAAHTLEIDTTGNAGVVDFVGIYGTRSDAAGVEILKMGNSGTTAFRMQAYNEFVTAPLAELQPDLALVILGTNDYRSTVSPPSVYIDGLQGLVEAARAAVPDMGFIFVVPPQSNPDGQQVPLSDYRDALFEWADAEGHEVISWLDRWPDFATANDRGLWRDNLHPSSLGGRVGAQDTINRLMKG